jgi:hypothetical protein
VFVQLQLSSACFHVCLRVFARVDAGTAQVLERSCCAEEAGRVQLVPSSVVLFKIMQQPKQQQPSSVTLCVFPQVLEQPCCAEEAGR